MLVNDPNDPSVVVAAQVLEQDRNPGHIPFQSDELVIFAKAANKTDKVKVTVVASTHDLETLGKTK
ncbi:hypothetical protein DOCECA_12585 [Pseudomonas sp. E102]